MNAVAKAVDEKTIEVVLQDGETEQRLLLIRSDILNKAIQLVVAAGLGEDGYPDIPPGGCYDVRVTLYPDMEYALIVAKWWEHEFDALHISVLAHWSGELCVPGTDKFTAPWGIGNKKVENIIEVLVSQGYVMPTLPGTVGLTELLGRGDFPDEGGPNSGHTGGGGPPRRLTDEERREAIALGRQQSR